MKHIIFLSFLLILGNLTFAANSTAPVVKKTKPVKNILHIAAKNFNSLSPNIIPIITLNDKVKNEEGISQHWPCAATRMTPTLLLTAAHCFAGVLGHGSRVYADTFESDDGVQGLVFANPTEDNLVVPNAQIFLYRPQYTDPGNIDPPFDFAVVVLDKGLKYNQAAVKKLLEQANLNMLPENFRNNVSSMIINQMGQNFTELSSKYSQFINKQLDEVALLTMAPQGVEDELKGKTLKSYFWNGEEWSTRRYSLRKLIERFQEKDPRSSHKLVFTGDTFHPGTSGSPIFDTTRKVVVSVASGTIGEYRNLGGLIDEALCQWVKKHDSKVKCLVRHDNIVANEQEYHRPIVAPN